MSIPKRRLFASFWDSPPPERPAGHINPKTIWNNYLQSGRGQRVGVAGMSARRRERGRRAARGARRRSWGGGALAWAVSARVGRGAWGEARGVARDEAVGEGKGAGKGSRRRQQATPRRPGVVEGLAMAVRGAAGRGRRPGEGRGGDVGEAKGAWAAERWRGEKCVGGGAWGAELSVRGCQWGCQCGGRRPSWS